MKNNNNCLNDGFVKIYKDNIKRGGFGAKQNISSIDDLFFIAKLAYKEMSKREQDILLLENQNKNLNLKVKVRYRKDVSSEHKLVLNDILFDIVEVDVDRTNRFMYLYCEEVMSL